MTQVFGPLQSNWRPEWKFQAPGFGLAQLRQLQAFELTSGWMSSLLPPLCLFFFVCALPFKQIGKS